MVFVRIIQWIARIAWLGAISLGLLYWIVGIDLISFHMLFGITLALSMLILSIISVCTPGNRLLGAIGIGYALVLPLFGLTQMRILVGDLHWLIRSLHLLVGIGAIVLIQFMGTRYERLRGMKSERNSFAKTL